VPAEPGQPAMTGNRLKVVDDQAAYFRLRSAAERTPQGMYETLKRLLEIKGSELRTGTRG